MCPVILFKCDGDSVRALSVLTKHLAAMAAVTLFRVKDMGSEMSCTSPILTTLSFMWIEYISPL